MDLTAAASRFGLAASWEGSDGARPQRTWEIDVVALALTVDGNIEREEDLVFYNQPSTPDGSIRLTVDGDSEQSIEFDLEALTDETMRVRIAAAIDGEATFGGVGAIRLSLSDSDTGQEVASATLDAATEERSLVLAEL
jgi:DNA polymerase-3 subunit epsilon